MNEAITCKTCGRAVWSHHVSELGNCVLCQPVGTATTLPAFNKDTRKGITVSSESTEIGAPLLPRD